MSLAQGNNTPTRSRIEPGSPDPESDTLTTRPVRPLPVMHAVVVVRSKEQGCDATYYSIFAAGTCRSNRLPNAHQDNMSV